MPNDLPADLTIDVLRHDEAALVEQTHAMLELARDADAPDLPPLLLRRFHGNLKWHEPGWEFRCYIARSGGHVLGALRADFPTRDNLHFTEGDLAVHPGHRRRGVGTALLNRYLDDARADGRTEISMIGRATWGGGPVRSDAGARFIERHGFTQALIEVDRRCAVDALDPADEARLWADATAAAGEDYRIISWIGSPPEALLDPLSHLHGMILDEIPTGDLELESETIDVEMVRASAERREKIGYVTVQTVAVHDATGAIAADTHLYAFDDHEHGYQSITIADPRHRGHRLGMLVKLANLRQLRAHFPVVTTLWTGNADVNAHMIAINDALGFTPVDALVTYRRTYDR